MIKMKSQQTSITNSFLLIQTGISGATSRHNTNNCQVLQHQGNLAVWFLFFPQKHNIQFTRPQSLLFAELTQEVYKGEICTYLYNTF